MRHVCIFATMAIGALAAFSLVSKQELQLSGHVTTNSDEIEAVWYPE